MTTDTTGGLPRLLSPLELPPQVNRWPGERDDGKLTWIYGLSDPRDGQVHVVARSANPERAGVAVEAGAVPAQPTPLQRWVMSLWAEHRMYVTHLLACVPMADGESYKRIYAAVARELGAVLFGTYHRPDWWSRTDPDWAPVWAEAAWVLHQAYPGLPLREGAAPPVYEAEALHRLSRPGLTREEWLDRYHRLADELAAEWELGGSQMVQRPEETAVQYTMRVGWVRLAASLLRRGITPWPGAWEDKPHDWPLREHWWQREWAREER